MPTAAIRDGWVLRATTLRVVTELFSRFHAYKSVSSTATYCFGVFEDDVPVAAFVWQPPPPGLAASVLPVAPYGVLSLSRMVAVPPTERRLTHISNPLRQQMKHLIDRTRWPALVTFSDAGVGHTGHVYKCSGWQQVGCTITRNFCDADGLRTSPYSNGKYGGSALVEIEPSAKTRWEHLVCDREDAANYIASHGWRREPIPGHVWKSGNQAYRFVKDA